MMKKNLSQAVALAASLGMAASAHAVNVNQDGLGQVLLYPVYTVEDGNFTAIHVTNTTDQIKAVKVRFLEGMNSQEVLDFNLYLSPYDVWTGNIVRTADGAALTSADNSCTAGAIPESGQPFVNFLYGVGSAADSVAGTDRTRVGHIEIIEMGDVDPSVTIAPGVTTGQAIIHGANGMPGNCQAVRDSLQPGGLWRADIGLGMSVPSGGLYGSGTIINVAQGTQIGFDPVALDNFADTQLHALPGDENPSLAEGIDTATFKNGTSSDFIDSVDAVSAVLMKENIKNDYAVGAGLNAQTDFVVTFPTKRLYVNSGSPIEPFTSVWNPLNSSACETIDVTYYDREERTQQLTDSQFSPRPPEGDSIALCWETNIMGISGSNVLGGQYVRTDLDLGPNFTTGWLNIDFTTSTAGERELESTGGTEVTLEGLPAIGFAITAIQNNSVNDEGALANFAGSWVHKATTSVDSAD